MRLIIRDEKPKEDTCEIWLEHKCGYIHLMSKIGEGTALIEVVVTDDMKAHHTPNGNFIWDKE